MKNITLSVIIVNYNGENFLQSCLDSLKEKLILVSHEIIILDNNSKDNSCKLIKEKYPNVKLVESDINYGFGKGNNEAVKYAQGEFLLLYNNDTILLDDISSAVNFLKERQDVGVIGIKMLNGTKRYLQSAFKFPSILNLFLIRRVLYFDKEIFTGNFSKEAYEVDWLTGSFLLLKKEVYEKINGFDEDYFMYVEDVDFCKKIADLGLKRYFIPSLSYIHYVGFNKKKNPLLIKGYKIYIKKHFKGISYFFGLLAININSFVKELKLVFKID